MKTLSEINTELVSVSTLLETKNAIVKPNAKTKREIKVLTDKVNALTKESLALEALESVNPVLPVGINTDLLNQLTAVGITENVKLKNSKNQIFKKDINDKSKRQKVRTMLLNSISLYLLHTAHNKVDLAKESLDKIIDVCKASYLAEDSFKAYNDYCTENMDENKKGAIKLFIEVYNKSLTPALVETV